MTNDLKAKIAEARREIAERANNPHPNLSDIEVQYAIGKLHGFDQAVDLVWGLLQEADHGGYTGEGGA